MSKTHRVQLSGMVVILGLSLILMAFRLEQYADYLASAARV